MSGQSENTLSEALRKIAEMNRDQATEQQTAMPSYSEFWRGRAGAFVDMLACLDDHAPALTASVSPASEKPAHLMTREEYARELERRDRMHAAAEARGGSPGSRKETT